MMLYICANLQYSSLEAEDEAQKQGQDVWIGSNPLNYCQFRERTLAFVEMEETCRIGELHDLWHKQQVRLLRLEQLKSGQRSL
jgi:hypothetical protein